MNDKSTIEDILQNNKSVTRFGDGEVNLMIKNLTNSFQDSSEPLTLRLREVLSSNLDGLLICLPLTLNTSKAYNFNAKSFWRETTSHQRAFILYFITANKFGNSLFTRPYMDYNNKKNTSKKFNGIMSLWENKDILIIEGTDTYFGVNNDLLKNSKSVKRIIGPNKNAFDVYDELLSEAIKVDKTSLILIALGATATILAYDLSKLGFQAIDIGHVDIEYEWFLKNATKKTPIPGKYVNETSGKITDKQLYKNDKLYLDTIITRVANPN